MRTIQYREVGGDGSPVIFLHGNGSNGDYWEDVLDHMKDRHRITVDLVGHGDSSRPDVEYSLATHETYLISFMDTIGVDSAVIVGHSYGGMIALWLGATNPQRVIAVAALQTPYSFESMKLGPFRHTVMKPGPVNRATRALAASSLGRAVMGDRHLLQNLDFTQSAFSADYRQVLASVEQPTLIANSQGDTFVPASHGEAYLDAIESSVPASLPMDADHHAPRDFPSETARVICDFLDEVDPLIYRNHDSATGQAARY